MSSPSTQNSEPTPTTSPPSPRADPVEDIQPQPKRRQPSKTKSARSTNPRPQPRALAACNPRVHRASPRSKSHDAKSQEAQKRESALHPRPHPPEPRPLISSATNDVRPPSPDPPNQRKRRPRALYPFPPSPLPLPFFSLLPSREDTPGSDVRTPALTSATHASPRSARYSESHRSRGARWSLDRCANGNCSVA